MLSKTQDKIDRERWLMNAPFKHDRNSVDDENPQGERQAGWTLLTAKNKITIQRYFRIQKELALKTRIVKELKAYTFRSKKDQNLIQKTYLIAFDKNNKVDPSYMGLSNALNGNLVSFFSINIPK